jgi:hypothetical protein
VKSVSFAQTAKEEAARFARSDEAKRSLLSSFVRINGYLRLNKGKEGLELASESASIAKAVYQDLHDLYGVEVRFAYTRSAGFLKRIVYHVIVDKEASDILSDLGVDFFAPSEMPKTLVASPEQRAAYLAGAFLASGSVTDPASSNYHFEIALSDETYAKWLVKLFGKNDPHPFSAKLVKRRSKFVVYLKRSDEIADFLVLIGAKESCLQFEDVRISRDFANIGNRLQNLDTANYGRTEKAGERQTEEIAGYVKFVGWDHIDNPKFKALLELRVKNPDASYGELAKMLSEELNTEISKSNVNHLFRSLGEEMRKARHDSSR